MPNRIVLVALPAPMSGPRPSRLVSCMWVDRASKLPNNVRYERLFSGFDWNRASPGTECLKLLFRAIDFDYASCSLPTGFPEAGLPETQTVALAALTLELGSDNRDWSVYLAASRSLSVLFHSSRHRTSPFSHTEKNKQVRCGHAATPRPPPYRAQQRICATLQNLAHLCVCAGVHARIFFLVRLERL